jgi:ABC-type Fe3+ transport system permease subunit
MNMKKPQNFVIAAARWTLRIALMAAVLLVAYGIFALRAAERSAADGGGLLGGFGFLPLGLGIVLGALAGICLLLIRSLK